MRPLRIGIFESGHCQHGEVETEEVNSEEELGSIIKGCNQFKKQLQEKYDELFEKRSIHIELLSYNIDPDISKPTTKNQIDVTELDENELLSVILECNRLAESALLEYYSIKEGRK